MCAFPPGATERITGTHRLLASTTNDGVLHDDQPLDRKWVAVFVKERYGWIPAKMARKPQRFPELPTGEKLHEIRNLSGTV
ncbi:MAG: hypothetical protein KDA58_09790 [Planctomycetaceae bacterium]|nr:hypothetical protein [Planctomycetaceae bacterium]